MTKKTHELGRLIDDIHEAHENATAAFIRHRYARSVRILEHLEEHLAQEIQKVQGFKKVRG